MRREQRWRRDWKPARRLAAILACGLLASPGPLAAAASADSRSKSPAAPAVRWVRDQNATNRWAVEVSGLNRETLEGLRRAEWSPGQWRDVLAVYAEQGDLMADIGLPAMLGNCRVAGDAIRFDPQFPLVPAVNYRAVFQPANLPGGKAPGSKPITAAFRLPAANSTPTTVVSHVYPSATVLPENLLKFYIHFSAPMSGGHIYEHIHLRDATGKAIELPFLEIDEELWNPSMTRLTLFIDPGRIKRGVRPLEEIGPSLESGRSYVLRFDREWADAAGLPLKAAFQKSFRVGPPDREPPDPARWKIVAPRSKSQEPLTVTFPEPMDHALAQRVIRVARKSGELLEGRVTLENEERVWKFVPTKPWPTGSCMLAVQTTIEDLAGNNIGKTFEVDLFQGVQRRMTNSTVQLPFEPR